MAPARPPARAHASTIAPRRRGERPSALLALLDHRLETPSPLAGCRGTRCRAGRSNGPRDKASSPVVRMGARRRVSAGGGCRRTSPLRRSAPPTPLVAGWAPGAGVVTVDGDPADSAACWADEAPRAPVPQGVADLSRRPGGFVCLVRRPRACYVSIARLRTDRETGEPPGHRWTARKPHRRPTAHQGFAGRERGQEGLCRVRRRVADRERFTPAGASRRRMVGGDRSGLPPRRTPWRQPPGARATPGLSRANSREGFFRARRSRGPCGRAVRWSDPWRRLICTGSWASKS